MRQLIWQKTWCDSFFSYKQLICVQYQEPMSRKMERIPDRCMYSETCSCDHLYSEATCIQRPLGHVIVSIVTLPCILPLFKDLFFWPKHVCLIQVLLYDCTFALTYRMIIACACTNMYVRTYVHVQVHGMHHYTCTCVKLYCTAALYVHRIHLHVLTCTFSCHSSVCMYIYMYMYLCQLYIILWSCS